MVKQVQEMEAKEETLREPLKIEEKGEEEYDLQERLLFYVWIKHPYTDFLKNQMDNFPDFKTQYKGIIDKWLQELDGKS